MPTNPADFELDTIEEFIAEANQDSDPVSQYFLGTYKKSVGAILIVKGETEAHAVYDLLCKNGLITRGKPVIDPKPFSPH